MNEQDLQYKQEAEAILKEACACSFTLKHVPVDDPQWQDGYINGYIVGRRKKLIAPAMEKEGITVALATLNCVENVSAGRSFAEWALYMVENYDATNEFIQLVKSDKRVQKLIQIKW